MQSTNYTNKNKFLVNIKEIEQITVYIQKKIHDASNKCNFCSIVRFQKYLLDRNEYSLIFIKRILCCFERRYRSSKIYNNKLIVYLYFSFCYQIKSLYNITNFIKYKIYYHYLILLLEPELMPRYKYTDYSENQPEYFHNILSNIYTFFRDKKFNQHQFIGIDIRTQIPNTEVILPFVGILQKVSNKFKNKFNRKTVFYYSCLKIYRNFKFLENECYIYKLLYSIICTELEWCIYQYTEIKDLYRKILVFHEYKKLIIVLDCSILTRLRLPIAQFLDKLGYKLDSYYLYCYRLTDTLLNKELKLFFDARRNLIIEPSQLSFKKMLIDIRNILYKKNYKNLWRVNKLIGINQAKHLVKNIIYQWCSKYTNILTNKIIVDTNEQIDKIFYIWQSKR